MSESLNLTAAQRAEKANSQFVFLGNYCGRIEKLDGFTLYIRFDDVSLHGEVQAAHDYFCSLHEQGTELPAERIWADGGCLRITAYRYDPERRLIRMKTERTTRPADA